MSVDIQFSLPPADDGTWLVSEINGVEIMVNDTRVRFCEQDLDISEFYEALMDEIESSAREIAMGPSALVGVRWSEITRGAKKVVLNQLFMGETDPARRICMATFILTVYAIQLYVYTYAIHTAVSRITPPPSLYVSESHKIWNKVVGMPEDLPIVYEHERSQDLNAILRVAMHVQTPIGALHSIVTAIMSSVEGILEKASSIKGAESAYDAGKSVLVIALHCAYSIMKAKQIRSVVFPKDGAHGYSNIMFKWQKSTLIKYSTVRIKTMDTWVAWIVTLFAQDSFSVILKCFAKYSAYMLLMKNTHENFKMISNFIPIDAKNTEPIDFITYDPLAESPILVQTFDGYVYSSESLLTMERHMGRAIVPMTNTAANFDAIRQATSSYVPSSVRMRYNFRTKIWARA